MRRQVRLSGQLRCRASIATEDSNESVVATSQKGEHPTRAEITRYDVMAGVQQEAAQHITSWMEQLATSCGSRNFRIQAHNP
jgi:hypothetical protein